MYVSSLVSILSQYDSLIIISFFLKTNKHYIRSFPLLCAEYSVFTFPFLAVVTENLFPLYIFSISMFLELFHLLISSVTSSPPLLLSHNRLRDVLITSSHKIVFSPTYLLYLATAHGYQRPGKTKQNKTNHSMRCYRIFSCF